MDQPRNPYRPQADPPFGLGRHGPVCVVATPPRCARHRVVAPPRLRTRGAPNGPCSTCSTAF